MDTTHIGVLRVVLHVPGARSLKDSRQVVTSLRDRLRHRFDVACNEVEPGDSPVRRVLVVTTAGNDPRLIRSILDRARGFVEASGMALVVQVDADVFPWHPSGAP